MTLLSKLKTSNFINKFFSRVACPTCQHAFMMETAPYRCVNSACEKEPDRIIEQAFSLTVPPSLGRVFHPPYMDKWWLSYKRLTSQDHQDCPSCHEPSYLRLCPSCHAPIPYDYSQYPVYLFLMVGSHRSGKSSYLNGMLQRLRDIGPDGYTIHIAPADGIKSPWHPQLYRISHATQGNTIGFVVFYEIPSEASLTYEKLHPYRGYLRRAQGVFFFLDPATFPGLGGAKKRLSEQVVETVSAYLRQLTSTKQRDSLPPAAFVLTKLDLLMNFLPTTTILRQDTRPDGAYNDKDTYQVSREIQGYLGTWSGPGLLQVISYTFLKKPYRFFVSATDIGKTEPQDYAPLRLEEPFLWLFQQAHGKSERVVDKRNRKRQNGA